MISIPCLIFPNFIHQVFYFFSQLSVSPLRTVTNLLLISQHPLLGIPQIYVQASKVYFLVDRTGIFLNLLL
jgi:hypothetical protein